MFGFTYPLTATMAINAEALLEEVAGYAIRTEAHGQ